MDILEIIIYILTIIMIGIIFTKKTIEKRYIAIFLSLFATTFLLYLIIGNTRWQLYTFYIAFITIGIIVYLVHVMHYEFKKVVRSILTIMLSMFIAISMIAIFVFPIYSIPTPTGDYLVGTESYIIEDEQRDELYTNDLNDQRKINIQMWYPAETVEGYEKYPWLEGGTKVSRGLSRDIGLPFFVLDHTAKIMSNSYLKAPISNTSDAYPIVVISHGWRGFKNLHTDFAEELASIGYIVISIDHTYGSVATVFSDSEVAYLNADALPERNETPDFLDYANQLVYTYAGDVITTIDYLEALNSDSSSQFNNRLNLEKIGLLGHSTGGGADVAVALEDSRIDAVIGLDAWVEPIVDTEINKGLSIPSLFIRSETWETGNNNIDLSTLIDQSTYPSLLYQIDGTTHYDFTMVYMYSPLTKLIGFRGEIDSMYLNSILKAMISSFFDQTLKDDPNSEIHIDSWEEVKLIP